MTYLELLGQLGQLSIEQMMCTVTVEDGSENECYPAELRIADVAHDSLDEDHPVIYFK